MYRIVTRHRVKGASRPVVEHGPWHPTLQAAEQWADHLRTLGYLASIEGHGQEIVGHDVTVESDLAEALANMA